jgi:hypothetical protein
MSRCEWAIPPPFICRAREKITARLIARDVFGNPIVDREALLSRLDTCLQLGRRSWRRNNDTSSLPVEVFRCELEDEESALEMPGEDAHSDIQNKQVSTKGVWLVSISPPESGAATLHLSVRTGKKSSSISPMVGSPLRVQVERCADMRVWIVRETMEFLRTLSVSESVIVKLEEKEVDGARLAEMDVY